MTQELILRSWGRSEYTTVWRAMQEFTTQRGPDTADELWLVADGRAAPFDGDLEDYRAWVEARRARAITPPPAPAVKPQREAPVRKKALLSKQARLESELEAAQARLGAVQARLADPATYAVPGNPDIAGLNRERETLEARIAELENAWLDLATALEQAG